MKNILTVGLGLTLIAGLLGGCQDSSVDRVSQEAVTEGKVSDLLRAEHDRIREGLGQADVLTAMLLQVAPSQREAAVQRIVGLLEEQVRYHAEEDERKLYAAADRIAGGGRWLFTATLRHEHLIARRWLDDLVRESRGPDPDLVAFRRHADRLLGLLEANHLTEEAVLFPLLNGALTPEQFRREVVEGESPPANPPPSIHWSRTYAEAQALSKTSGKPILIHFSGSPCSACRKMEKVTFADPEVCADLEQGFVPVYIDVGKDEETAIQFDVVGIPATHVLAPDGRLLSQQVGFLEPAAFLLWIRDARERMGSRQSLP